MTVRDLPHYVYQLEYADGTPFYIGVGVKDRVSQHRRLARRNAHYNKAMNESILQAEAAGQVVIQRLLARFARREDALEYEKLMIARTPGLLNIRRYRRLVEPVVEQVEQSVEVKQAEVLYSPVDPRRRAKIQAALDDYYRVFRTRT